MVINVFDRFIAPAGRRYETSMVEDGDAPAAVGDELAFLQRSRCQVDADSPHAQHLFSLAWYASAISAVKFGSYEDRTLRGRRAFLT